MTVMGRYNGNNGHYGNLADIKFKHIIKYSYYNSRYNGNNGK